MKNIYIDKTLNFRKIRSAIIRSHENTYVKVAIRILLKKAKYVVKSPYIAFYFL